MTELAERLEVHVQQLANTRMGLSMQDWDRISNDILEASRVLAALSAPTVSGLTEEGWRGRIEMLNELPELYWKCHPHGPNKNEHALLLWEKLRTALNPVAFPAALKGEVKP